MYLNLFGRKLEANIKIILQSHINFTDQQKNPFSENKHPLIELFSKIH